MKNISNYIQNLNLKNPKKILKIVLVVAILLLGFTIYWLFIREEPNGYFWPKGHDNTDPYDTSDILKQLPEHGCNDSTSLLVAIRSSPEEFDKREWIRNSWGVFRSHTTPVIFVIANPKDENITRKVEDEQQNHGDLLLLNFDDDYRNLSLKNYGMFKYFVEYCPHANCLLKPDSDTVTNIVGFEKLCNLSNRIFPDDKVLTSYVYNHSAVVRSSGNKWYVPKYVYPKAYYDPYAIGWGFFFTGKNAIKDLLEALNTQTPFFKSENYRRLPDDSIQAGEVRILANISIQHNTGFNFGDFMNTQTRTLYLDPITNQSVPLMTEAVDNKEEVWKEFQKILIYNKFKEAIDHIEKELFSGEDEKNAHENHDKFEEVLTDVSISCRILSMLDKKEIEEKFKDISGYC